MRILNFDSTRRSCELEENLFYLGQKYPNANIESFVCKDETTIYIVYTGNLDNKIVSRFLKRLGLKLDPEYL